MPTLLLTIDEARNLIAESALTLIDTATTTRCPPDRLTAALHGAAPLNTLPTHLRPFARAHRNILHQPGLSVIRWKSQMDAVGDRLARQLKPDVDRFDRLCSQRMPTAVSPRPPCRRWAC